MQWHSPFASVHETVAGAIYMLLYRYQIAGMLGYISMSIAWCVTYRCVEPVVPLNQKARVVSELILRDRVGAA